MLGLKSVMNVIDNSGAVQAELINVFKCKPSRKKSVGVGYVGDEVKVVVKKARSIAATTPGQQGGLVQKIRRGDMARAVIVRTKKEVQRADGRMIRFDDSACVLLNNKGEMMGTRISGPVSAALRDFDGGGAPGGKWAKVISLAPKVV